MSTAWFWVPPLNTHFLQNMAKTGEWSIFVGTGRCLNTVFPGSTPGATLQIGI